MFKTDLHKNLQDKNETNCSGDVLRIHQIYLNNGSIDLRRERAGELLVLKGCHDNTKQSCNISASMSVLVY